MNYIANDEIFEKKDFDKELLPKGEYNNCEFRNCNLNQVDLSGYRFIDCEFKNCDMSMVVLENTSLQNVKFRETKLIGSSLEAEVWVKPTPETLPLFSEPSFWEYWTIVSSFKIGEILPAPREKEILW